MGNSQRTEHPSNKDEINVDTKKSLTQLNIQVTGSQHKYTNMSNQDSLPPSEALLY